MPEPAQSQPIFELAVPDVSLMPRGQTIGRPLTQPSTVDQLMTNMSVVFGFRVLGVGVNFLTALLLAHLLGPVGQGLYAALTLLWLVVLMVLGLGLPTINSVFAGREGYDPGRLISNSIWLTLFAAVMSGLLAIAI